MNQPLYQSVMGVDVSKRRLDACCLPERDLRSAANNAEGIESLLVECRAQNVQLVCVEATGGLERDLVKACNQAQLPIAVVNPRRIRDFAKSLNRLAKTDDIDRQTIALFASRMEPTPTPPCDENAEKLRALITRRQQVSDMITQEKNRLQRQPVSQVRDFVQQAIDLYQQQLKQLETEIQNVIRQNDEFRAKADLLLTVPGIGALTAATLLAEFSELGYRSSRQLAALLGVAPMNRDSGQLRGKRMTGGGRSKLRHRLFMPTIVATRYNPTIRAFYQKLLSQGKTKMVALIAAMRKLITCINAMIKTGQPWKTA